MTKYLVAAFVLVFAVAGCGDDNTSPLTPGDVNDPQFGLFMSMFNDIDEGNGLMVDSMFGIVDGILSGTPGGPAAAPGDFQYTLEYDGTNERWVGWASATDPESGVSFTMQHTVQFVQDGTHVQYPDPELLDRINGTTELEVTGEGITSAGGSQNMVVEVDHLEQDVLLTLNGTGSAHLDLTTQETTQTGTRTCDIAMGFDATVDGIQMWGSQTGESGGCPVGGSVSYTGTADIGCTGTGEEGSVSGRWTVTRSFSESGMMTTRVVSGGNLWELEEPCL